MFYPLGGLTPDIQTPPQAKLPDSPSAPINQVAPQRAQLRATESLTQVNRPRSVVTASRIRLSPNTTLAVLNAATVPQNPAQLGGSISGPNLRLGSRGEVVETLQTRLQELTYYPGAIDGIFGPLTQQAVQNFQQAEGLAVDGLVGPETWQRLQGQPASQPSPQPSAKVAVSAPGLPSNQPLFTPATLPPLKFHAMGSATVDYDPTKLWIVVMTIAGLGGAILGFRPDILNPDGSSSGIQAAKTATAHHPQPIYPTHHHRADPEADSLALLSNLDENTLAHGSSQISWVEDLERLRQTSPWAVEAVESYLPTFIYDLQQPESRLQLEAVVQGSDAPALLQPSNHLSGLWRRLGTFPERNRRTGNAYTYRLLDDMGGCFRLCDHELWVTQTALRWLSDDIPYNLTIRRFDHYGRVLDKDFVVQLNSQQLQMAS